ncbi:MFS general substrate transporter [Pholiota conissans]|uniref:MFS general substrate transporter n=1 Tax=Pholiota conissans TaxID=109636 RepID=A0A9P5Z2K7_9AGAR|nr:MFS general substrate transporter [Pholiota conissans]
MVASLEKLSVDDTKRPDSLADQKIEEVSDSANSVKTDILDSPNALAEVKRAVRRIDLAIVPIMTMFYLLSFLDRANIGNARVAGLQKGLGITDRQYSICITITYIPYVLSEIPSNLLMRKIGPNIAMPAILTIWGIIVTLQGLVSSFAGLATARFFLGLVEGPMFPGIVLYLSGFYTREELSLRIAFFFSAASLSGAFSGLLAAAISNMHGVGGKPAWSWIFILEGLFTICFGVSSFWFVPQTPRHAKFLSDHEKDLVMARLERDRPFINPLDSFSLKYVAQSLTSPHVILVFIAYFMSGTNLFGLALFLPSIVNQLGNSPNKSQLLSVGPFAAAFVLTIIVSFISDRIKNRVIPVCTVALVAVAGYAMYLASHTKHTAYGALYLMVPGVYTSTPVIAAWLANNSEPHYVRATTIAAGFMATNIGGILSTWRYPTKEGPRFRKTTIMNLVFQLGIILLSLINAAYLHYQNKQKKQNRAKLLAPYDNSKETDGGVQAWVDLGDRHPDFHYIL